jgi:hypothetical protein
MDREENGERNSLGLMSVFPSIVLVSYNNAWSQASWSIHSGVRGLSLTNRGDHPLGRLKSSRHRLPFGFVYARRVVIGDRID